MRNLLLFESYKSQKEIEQLAEFILIGICENTLEIHNKRHWTKRNDLVSNYQYEIKFKSNLNKYTDLHGDGIYVVEFVSYNNEVYFKGYESIKVDIEDIEFKWSDNNKNIFRGIYGSNIGRAVSGKRDRFSELKNFIIDNSSIAIRIDKSEENTKGSFVNTNRKPYIVLYFKERNWNFILRNWSKDKMKGKVMDKDNLYYSIRSEELISVIIHELTHAYDWYRSKGNYINTKKSKEYFSEKEKMRSIERSKEIFNQELTDEENELLHNYYKKYLNLRHEIDARFAQALKDINFYKVVTTNDSYSFKMNAWDDIYLQMKMRIRNWDDLSDKDKKRLTRKLSQFYHFEMDLVAKKNQSK